MTIRRRDCAKETLPLSPASRARYIFERASWGWRPRLYAHACSAGREKQFTNQRLESPCDHTRAWKRSKHKNTNHYFRSVILKSTLISVPSDSSKRSMASRSTSFGGKRLDWLVNQVAVSQPWDAPYFV